VIFNSVTFILFLTAVVCAYWCLPQRARQWLIALSSLTFYAFWRPEFTLVMLASAATDYFVALEMNRHVDDRVRRRWLYVSFAVNLGLLLYFKYLFFIESNGVALLRLFGVEISDPVLNVVLPLGISFYTFETISYSVDVYRRAIQPERDLLSYACFITFFPKLIAGPILRAHQLIPQLKARATLTTDNVAEGLRRIVMGLFLKVCLADNIAPVVDDGFSQPLSSLSALDVWTLAFLFGFQIYLDFCGYSHIAIGCSRLLGIRLIENFNFPYTAVSPRDFWQRWHMSLSNWIRDYLYLPLMGTRPAALATTQGVVAGDRLEGDDARLTGWGRSRALFVTWAIMGLWHGANWTFLLWGLFHATCIYGYRATGPIRRLMPQTVRAPVGLLVTLPLMMASWILFRADSVATAIGMYYKLAQPREYLWLGLRENVYLFAAVLLVLVLVARPIYERLVTALDSRPVTSFATNAAAFSFLGAMVFVFLRPISQFIYFAF
jgi:D-alanyl-lipoteichoic acid acyltransferase DltB (MBOAT superfamily)